MRACRGTLIRVSIYNIFLCFLLIFIINALGMAVCSLARIFSICFTRFSTTIEKSVEIRLYSPRLYVTFVRILFRSLRASRLKKKKRKNKNSTVTSLINR